MEFFGMVARIADHVSKPECVSFADKFGLCHNKKFEVADLPDRERYLCGNLLPICMDPEFHRIVAGGTASGRTYYVKVTHALVAGGSYRTSLGKKPPFFRQLYFFPQRIR